ncbi:564_t:CDS:2, partial [Ambispora gerdemannii]
SPTTAAPQGRVGVSGHPPVYCKNALTTKFRINLIPVALPHNLILADKLILGLHYRRNGTTEMLLLLCLHFFLLYFFRDNENGQAQKTT